MNIINSFPFEDWTCLNDTIMGGKSIAKCTSTSQGLLLEGNVISEDGGFISCRSKLISPPIDLSNYNGFLLRIYGSGHTLKFAVGTSDNISRITQLYSTGLKWVSELVTNESGVTLFKVPFNSLKASIRARPINMPNKFQSSKIHQLQLLYSKFDISGGMNEKFAPGPIKIFIEEISVYK